MKSKTEKFGEFIGYSIIALLMLAIAVGGFFVHIAIVRFGLKLWPL